MAKKSLRIFLKMQHLINKRKGKKMLAKYQKSVGKIVKILSLGALAFVMMAPQATVMAAEVWGPERPTYTWAKPADHPTFNSMTDNPAMGNERNFVRIREAGTNNPFLDTVEVVPGKRYEVNIYVHNNASASLNESGKGTAKDVRLSTSVPERLKPGQAGVVKATIKASNTDPKVVWDSAFLNVKQSAVFMRYVPNSATIHNAGTANGTALNAKELFSDAGTPLAYYANQWGVIPGCNEFAGYITYELAADAPAFGAEKLVSLAGKNSFADNVVVKNGDVLDFKLIYKNTGTTMQTSVSVYDKLPKQLEFIPGSIKLARSNGKKYKMQDKLFGEGVSIGNYAAGESAEITYQAKVVNTELNCGDNNYYNEMSVATANGTMKDKVRIVMKKECTPTENPGTGPKEIPETGPAEVALLIVIGAGIIGGGFYWWHSRKTLKKLVDGDKTASSMQGEEPKLGE